MTEPNMKIEISLSDETIEKLAKLLVPKTSSGLYEAPASSKGYILTDAEKEEQQVPPLTAASCFLEIGGSFCYKPKGHEDEHDFFFYTDDVVEATVALIKEAEKTGVFHPDAIVAAGGSQMTPTGVTSDEVHLLSEVDCGFIDGRVSKAQRIKGKLNKRIGEPYYCGKPVGHAGKHIEGTPPETFEAPVEISSEEANKLASESIANIVARVSNGEEAIDDAMTEGVKTEPEGRTVVVAEASKDDTPVSTAPKGGMLVQRLPGYSDKINGVRKCGWWIRPGASSAKFCGLGLRHHDGAESNNPNDHSWISQPPNMVRK